MIKTIDKAQALQTLKPGAQWVLRGDELEWLDTVQVEPTENEIQTEIVRLQTEWDSKAYARARKIEYDKLNQFEMQFDDAANGTATWVDAINAIKAKYPKPE